MMSPSLIFPIFPPAAASGEKSASSKGANEIVGSITKAQLREIAETKLPDLNAYDVEAAMKIIEGTAKNMGVTVEDNANNEN